MIKDFLSSSDYENGYRQALFDVENWFSYHSEGLKHFRMYNSKKIPEILKCLVNNSDEFMAKKESLELVEKTNALGTTIEIFKEENDV